MNAFADLDAETLEKAEAADDDDAGIVFCAAAGDRMGVSIVLEVIFAVGDTDITDGNGRKCCEGPVLRSGGVREVSDEIEETLVEEGIVA